MQCRCMFVCAPWMTLDSVAVVVDDYNDDIQLFPDHGADLLYGHLPDFHRNE